MDKQFTIDPFKSPETNAIYYIGIGGAILTSLGLLIIILLYLVPENRNIGFRLIIYLTISECIFSLTNLFSRESNTDSEETSMSCQVEGFLRQFATWLSFLFASVISLYIYEMNCKNIYWGRKKEIKTILIAFTISIVFAIM